MNCSFSNPLTDDELSKLLDGLADDDLLHHIEQCPACEQRLKIASHIEGHLKANLFRLTCPDPQTLGNYHHGLLSDSERNTIEAHLKMCATCRSELQILASFLESDVSGDVPQADRQPDNVIRPPTAYFQAVAETMPLRKVRGKNKRQIRAVVNGIELLFDLQHSTAGIALEGLLIPVNKEDLPTWVGSLVEVRTPAELLCVCYIDDMGTFRCEPVPEGIVTLRITTIKGQTILVSELEIKM